MKNSRFELEVQFKDKKYLQLQKIQLDSGIESIIEEGKYKNWGKSKLKNKLQIKNEEIRKVALKIEKKDIKIFSSEIKYILEKEENIKLKDELILNKENITKISMNYNYTKNNNIYQIIILFLFISSFKLEKRREEKRLIIPGEGPRIKASKDKNGLFEDKNKSRKYLKKCIVNIIRNIFRYLIIISLIHSVLSNNNSIKYNFSNITLKINGIGNKNVISNYFNSNYYPNMIYINGIKQSTIKYSYNLNETDNFIELIWNNRIDSCGHMFEGCNDITEIDLSNFDTSLVTNMRYMFYNCYSLSSLNLSNFHTSLVTKMEYMFYKCSKLEYINLINFTETKLSYYNNMFDYVPDNIIVCLNENSNKIKIEIEKKNCYTIDCSYDWKIKQKKIVNKTGICIDNNNNDILYKYEYEGKYYENCLNGNLINNSTIQICNKEECLSSSNISLKDNLCIECNNEYYEIENDNYSSGYIKCYKDPIGYYLDNNIYKKCFYTCKECKINGNNITHNCIVYHVMIIIHIKLK